MCRHLGYVGPPIPVGDMLVRGPHSLQRQAWAPRNMREGGTINVEGFGVAWWRTGDSAASRYRNAAPIWTDPAVTEVLPQLESSSVLAAVRSATVGMPVERGACAPFLDRCFAFSHNGVVPDWRRTLTAVLSDLDGVATRAGVARLFETNQLLEAESATDSAALWVLLRRLLDPAVPTEFIESPSAALRLLVTTVAAKAQGARLNLLLGDGEQLWATVWEHSLSALVTEEQAVLASEPYDDDPRWRSLGEHSLVHARPGALNVESL